MKRITRSSKTSTPVEKYPEIKEPKKRERKHKNKKDIIFDKLE